jgi:predicted house-cleaning NTP pyrophosphatase (Maf/HAM1 superfamily)
VEKNGVKDQDGVEYSIVQYCTGVYLYKTEHPTMYGAKPCHHGMSRLDNQERSFYLDSSKLLDSFGNFGLLDR